MSTETTARDTRPVGVWPEHEYTFDQLITHLHDHHGMNAADQAEDETFNDTDPAVVERIRTMTREEAISRLPYHYFQTTGSPDSLESALITHRQQHADNPGGYGKVHFHPKAW